MAIVRIRHRNSKGEVNWYGSGIVIRKLGGNLYILSNQHVSGNPNDSGSLEAEFFDKSGHKSLGFFKVTVLQAIQKGNVDAAICRLPHGSTLDHIPTLPLGSDKTEANTLIVQSGCDGAKQVNQSLGYVLRRDSGLIWYLPSSYGGDSGSAIISEDGLRTIGLTAWQTYLAPITGTVGLAQTVPSVVGAFKEGTFSRLPSNVFSVADQRFGLRRPKNPVLPRKPSPPPIDQEELDDIFGLESGPEDSPEIQDEPLDDAEEGSLRSGPLRNLLDRLLKGQEDIKDGQNRDGGTINGLFSQIGVLQTAITWMWRGVIAVLVLGCIGLFANQGWLLRISVTIVRVFVRGLRAAYLVIVDAVTTPLPKNASLEQQLSSIRDQLKEDATDEREVD
jgi:hypothetical protein